MLQLKVMSCTVFTEVFGVLLKVTWEAGEPQNIISSFRFLSVTLTSQKH